MLEVSKNWKVQYAAWFGLWLMYFALTAGLIFLCIYFARHGAPRWVQPLLIFGFLGVFFGVARLVNKRLRATGIGQPMRPPMKRYMWRFMPSMMVYVVVLFTSMTVYRRYELESPLLWLVAIAPALPIIGAIAAIGLYLKEEDDEFQKTLAVSAYVWATGLTLAISTVWGFLETFKLVPHLPAWFVFPLLAMCLVPAQGIARWRYR